MKELIALLNLGTGEIIVIAIVVLLLGTKKIKDIINYGWKGAWNKDRAFHTKAIYVLGEVRRLSMKQFELKQVEMPREIFKTMQGTLDDLQVIAEEKVTEVYIKKYGKKEVYTSPEFRQFKLHAHLIQDEFKAVFERLVAENHIAQRSDDDYRLYVDCKVKEFRRVIKMYIDGVYTVDTLLDREDLEIEFLWGRESFNSKLASCLYEVRRIAKRYDEKIEQVEEKLQDLIYTIDGKKKK